MGARDLLEGDEGPPLPEAAFVFCSHQGYQFLFFEAGKGPDPEINYYLECEGSFQVVSPAFSDWLIQTVRNEFPHVPEWGSTPG